MFKVSRNDRDLLVVANKYIDELRNLPNEKLSSIQALIVVRSTINYVPPQNFISEDELIYWDDGSEHRREILSIHHYARKQLTHKNPANEANAKLGQFYRCNER